MYVLVDVKLKTKEARQLKVELPKDIRDFKQDTIFDVVGDLLEEKGIDFKSYKVVSQF
jgi:hypothetical protein